MRLVISASLIVFVCLPIALRAQISSLEALYKTHQYFALRDQVNRRTDDRSPDFLFYRGVVANRFNRLEESIRYLTTYRGTKNAEKTCDAYEILADNYVKTYRYAQAAEMYQTQLTACKDTLSEEKRADLNNSYGLWKALEKVPVQTLSVTGQTRLQGTRDKAKLLNLAVEVGGTQMDFVFDTGANLSTITSSTATRLGLNIIEADVSVGSSSDIKVKSKLGVAAELKLGNITLRNVVFLVLDDRSLFFPQANYQINGIIGFPIIEAIGSVTISRDDVLTTDRVERRTTEPNMALEELKPLVEATIGGEKMTFLLDSGAITSTFYPAFFKTREKEIVKTATRRKIRLGGAGGSQEVNAYFLKDLEMSIGGKTARLAKAEIITEAINEDSREFYGNLGQDVIKQFEKMTIDLKNMQLIFQ
jgi:predicted aspartyl protease